MDHVKPKRIALRRSAFRSWLASRKADSVGYACESNSCPLAMWLQDVHHTVFSVTDYTYECALFSVPCQLPAWAKVFIRLLDFTYPFYNEIKGVEAVSLLDEVERLLAPGSPEAWLPAVEV